MLPVMNPVLSRLLQLAVLLVALGALAFLLVEPVFEGRNAHSTPVSYTHLTLPTILRV